jgi:hypothetical protein
MLSDLPDLTSSMNFGGPASRRAPPASLRAQPLPLTGRGDQHGPDQVRQIDTPPSTRVAVPVMKLEASEARKAAARAISSGWAIRLRA